MTIERSYGALAVFVLIVFAAAAGGWLFPPGAWYAALWKPSWTPPDWLFAPVWTALYLMIAVAGWLIYSQPATVLARALWAAQLILNGIWSGLFFGLHKPAFALVDILALAACIAVLVIVSFRRMRAVFWLLLPYLAWVAYAAALNAAVAAGNPS